MTAFRRCPRCDGPTVLGQHYCGICSAVIFGMTDEQVAQATEAIKGLRRGRRPKPPPSNPSSKGGASLG